MARPQIKDANKLTDVTSKRHAKVLVLEAGKLDHEGACKARRQIKAASKQTDVISKRHAKALVLKLRKQANLVMKGHIMACP